MAIYERFPWSVINQLPKRHLGHPMNPFSHTINCYFLAICIITNKKLYFMISKLPPPQLDVQCDQSVCLHVYSIGL